MVALLTWTLLCNAGDLAAPSPAPVSMSQNETGAETSQDLDDEGESRSEIAHAGVEAKTESLPLLFDVSLTLAFLSRQYEPETALTQNEDGTVDKDALWRPRDLHLYGAAALAVAVEYEAADFLLWRALFDSGELRPGAWLDPPLDGLAADGQSIEEAAKSNAFIRTLSAVFLWGPIELEVGRRRTTIANGLLYDDYGTGLFFHLRGNELDLAPLNLEAAALLVGDTVSAFERPNPLFLLRLSYDLSLFESLGVYGALFVDQGNLYNLLASAVAERWIFQGPPTALCLAVALKTGVPQSMWPVSCLDVALDGLLLGNRGSSGMLGYVGFSGALLPSEGLSVRGAFALSTGRLAVDVTLDPLSFGGQEDEPVTTSYRRTFALLGYAASLDVHYDLGRHFDLLGESDLDLDVALFGFVLSGGQPPTQGRTYNAFVGVAPYWVWTGIFFSGGLSQGFYAGRTTAAGINGHGVFGGGPKVELGSEMGFLALRAAYLGAMASLPAQPRIYGLELDLAGGLHLGEWIRLEAEVDLFFAGHFFVDPRLGYRVLAWLNVGYAN